MNMKRLLLFSNMISCFFQMYSIEEIVPTEESSLSAQLDTEQKRYQNSRARTIEAHKAALNKINDLQSQIDLLNDQNGNDVEKEEARTDIKNQISLVASGDKSSGLQPYDGSLTDEDIDALLEYFKKDPALVDLEGKLKVLDDEHATNTSTIYDQFANTLNDRMAGLSKKTIAEYWAVFKNWVFGTDDDVVQRTNYLKNVAGEITRELNNASKRGNKQGVTEAQWDIVYKKYLRCSDAIIEQIKILKQQGDVQGAKDLLYELNDPQGMVSAFNRVKGNYIRRPKS